MSEMSYINIIIILNELQTEYAIEITTLLKSVLLDMIIRVSEYNGSLPGILSCRGNRSIRCSYITGERAGVCANYPGSAL